MSNKADVNGLVDELMKLWTIVYWSLIYFKHEDSICKVEQHQGNSTDEVENRDD